jgi:hypothetical protein
VQLKQRKQQVGKIIKAVDDALEDAAINKHKFQKKQLDAKRFS